MSNNLQQTNDGFIFSGNWQLTVSRALFQDRRLTPLERNAWQVIRMMLEPDGITALPTYEQLRPYLTSIPYAEKASFETVARALIVLRLTRWLSLSKKRRAKDGSRLSNLYILHDEPLTPFEAIQLDDEYFSLICQSISHASKTIQRVALGVLEDISTDPFLSGKRLPTRIEVLLERVSTQNKKQLQKQNLSTTHESEVCKEDLLRNQKSLTSESETSLKPSEIDTLRNPKSLVSSSNNNILLPDNTIYEIPSRFYKLAQAQQSGILKTIQKLSPNTQQQIFSEWDERCKTQAIRNPAAYLYGIVQKAFKGELNQFIDTSKEQLHQSFQQVVSPPVMEQQPQDNYTPPTPEQKAKILEELKLLKEKLTRN